MPADDATKITTASGSSSDLTVEITDNGNAVKVTGNGNASGYFVNITYGNNQTKIVNLIYENTTALSLDWNDSISLGMGESVSYQMVIGNRRVWEDQFSFALSDSLSGARLNVNGGRATISLGTQAAIGTKGTLTASRNGTTFTCNVTVDYPTLGIYKASTMSAENLLGSSENMTWNLNNANVPTTVYLIPNSGYTIDSSRAFDSRNATYVPENGYVKISVNDTSEAASMEIEVEFKRSDSSFRGNKSFRLVWEKREVADEPDTEHLFAGMPSKTTLTLSTSRNAQYGLTYYIKGKNGDLIEQWANRTFDLELKSDDPSYSIGMAYWNEFGNLEFTNLAPGTGTLIATKGNIRREMKIKVQGNGFLVYSDPDGAREHYIGQSLYWQANEDWTTVYLVRDPEANGTISEVTAINAAHEGEDETEWNGMAYEIINSGNAVKLTLEQSFIDNPDSGLIVVVWLQLTDGETIAVPITLYSGSLFVNDAIWASRTNATRLRTWDSKILDSSYTVSVQDGNGKTIPSRWIDEDYLMIDTRAVGNGNALKYTVTATKGSTTYQTELNTMYMPEFSTYTGTYEHKGDHTTTFLASNGTPVTFSDDNRTFYYYGTLTTHDLLSFVTDECSTKNENIEIGFTQERAWGTIGENTYEYMDGYKCMTLTLKEGVNTPQIAKINVTQQDYKYEGSDGKFHSSFLVMLIPQWMKDIFQPDTGTRNGMNWTLQDGQLSISGSNVEAYTSTLEFETRRDEITQLSLDSHTSEIGAGAFKDLDHLESVTVPGQTEIIGKNAFEGCNSLSEVTIPASVEKIDNTAFDNTADDLTIHGDAGDTYAETYAMINDITYESEPGEAEENGLSIGVGKTVGADHRMAVAAVIDNGGNAQTSGKVVAAIYYRGKLIATELLDSETATGKQDRLVMQLPYLQDLDADELDIQILYLGSNNAPLTEAATQESGQPAAFFRARGAATRISANATEPVVIEPDENKKFSINYTDVTEGEEYVLVAVKSGASIDNLTEDNLLYIQQQAASGSTVSFANFSLKTYENADVYMASAGGTKKIGTITADAKTAKTVTVTANDVTYGTPVTVTASSYVNDAVYSYRYTGSNYDSDKAPTAAGTYTVTATLVSDEYQGSGTAEFTISPKNLSACTVMEMQSVMESGSALTPAVTIMDGFSKLSAESDFIAVYSNNVAVGTASVSITGKGNYTGTASASFTIAKDENKTTSDPGTGGVGGGTGGGAGGVDEPTVDDNTVTMPNGSTVTTETGEDGSVSVSVTDADGKPVASITLPAQPGETGSFDDVKEGSWYENAVQDAVGYGLFSGTSETEFEPNTGTTRAMLAQVLYNLCGQTEYGESGTFTDADGWYEKAVNWAAAAGVVSGNGDGTFAPNDELTREQLVVMLYNFAKVINAENGRSTSLSTFPDGKQVSGWAQPAMQWALANGIVTGSKNGSTLTLNAQSTATRAEVAVIMVKFVNYLK